MRKHVALILLLTLLISLCACGNTAPEQTTAAVDVPETAAVTETAAAAPKVLHIAESFGTTSLDPRKESNSWYTSIYGITQTLFQIADDSSLVPWLAEKAEVDDSGLIWTVTIKENAHVSNGNDVTSQMVIRNLKSTAENIVNFAYLGDFQYDAVDEKTFTITTREINPTMLIDLAAPETAIVDLDNPGDYMNSIVGTGPFLLKQFQPEQLVVVEKDPNYWGGEVLLDEAWFHCIKDDDSRLMAMQNSEVDVHSNVNAAALEIYNAAPEEYTVHSRPATRLQFYFLNQERLSDNVRAAINLAVDPEVLASFQKGIVSPTPGPFNPEAPYGKVTKPACDPEKARSLLEEDGYTLNSKGFYEKNGQPLTVNISYYSARSLDVIALLMQEQLADIGIQTEMTCVEDPDSTYIASRDFDIGLYCMIADKAGDPYFFINSVLRDGCYYDIVGFDSPECEALIDQLATETDMARRADLANQIVQIAIDDNAFGFTGLFNKTTVVRNGVTGVFENNPGDFYRVNEFTDIR